MQDYGTLLSEALRRGYALEPALAALREQGATLIESVKVVREVTGMSLAEAHKAVTESQAWKTVESPPES